MCSYQINLLYLNTFLFSVYASSADLDVVDHDDGSIYNGDENHKVWTGSQDRLDANGNESPYDFYSSGGINVGGGSSTIGRTPRARQISAPVPVPSPPKEELKKRKDKKTKPIGSQSLSGTLIRPKPVYSGSLMRGGPPPPNAMIYGHPGMGPPMPPQRQFHTFSHRGFVNGAGGAHPNGGQMMPMGMHHPHHVQMAPPPPFMMPQQYATLQNPRNTKKKKKDKNGGLPIGMMVKPPMFAYPSSVISDPRPLALSNRKLAQSAAAGLDDSAGNSGAESPGGTGIYKRKGHLNERAFSYSIRQEHRSRSHGSLASLQFNPPDMMKEREIAQMVAGLDLNTEKPAIHSVPISTGTFGKPRR